MSVAMRWLVSPLVATAAATALIAVAVLGQAAPARAGGAGTFAAGNCPFTNTLCLFDGTSYTGSRFTVSSVSPNGVCVSLVDAGWSGRVRSAYNTNSRPAALFANDDCLGGPFQVSGASGVSDLGTFRPSSVWVR